MWHGPALAELLRDVTPQQASARPIAGAHTIWEIVLHVIAWSDIARARLGGERTGDPTPQEDWPAVAGASTADWAATVARVHDTYQSLATAVRALDDDALDRKVTGLDYSVSTLVRGVIEHGTYHGGQIALLRRATRR